MIINFHYALALVLVQLGSKSAFGIEAEATLTDSMVGVYLDLQRLYSVQRIYRVPSSASSIIDNRVRDWSHIHMDIRLRYVMEFVNDQPSGSVSDKFWYVECNRSGCVKSCNK
eukprot:6172599-Pleurochrysis_carterae.AAC.3